MQCGKVLSVIGGMINVVVSVCAIAATSNDSGNYRQFLIAGTVIIGLGVVLCIYGIFADLSDRRGDGNDEKDKKVSCAMGELQEMKNKGLVSEDEYKKVRKQLLQSLMETLE